MTKKASQQSGQPSADLRVCASCEWIFKKSSSTHPETGGCPKCGFAHYGARLVYGDAAYQHAKTQKPWFDRKMAAYAAALQQEIARSAAAEKAQQSLLRN